MTPQHSSANNADRAATNPVTAYANSSLALHGAAQFATLKTPPLRRKMKRIKTMMMR